MKNDLWRNAAISEVAWTLATGAASMRYGKSKSLTRAAHRLDGARNEAAINAWAMSRYRIDYGANSLSRLKQDWLGHRADQWSLPARNSIWMGCGFRSIMPAGALPNTFTTDRQSWPSLRTLENQTGGNVRYLRRAVDFYRLWLTFFPPAHQHRLYFPWKNCLSQE